MSKYSVCGRCRGFMFAILAVLYFTIPAAAQGIIDLNAHKGEPPKPHAIKVLEEHRDAKGNTIRTIRYDQGSVRVIETIIMPRSKFVGLHIPIRPDTMKKELVSVIVDKSHYCLEVMYRRKMIRVYKAVFGPKPLQNKCVEGDRCTPEGWFKIANKNPQSKYNKFMGLDYPNDSTSARFNKMKATGVLPATARMGGSVGIHGIWPGGDDMIELGVGWTDGCIALKNKDMDDLYTLVSVGTNVLVKK
ncbi:MAG: L,D-transpeptidase [Taibaiella sp.]|nr:L,D-transpeptidase [Taibaiella sp.]